jgi:hypothetical protein
MRHLERVITVVLANMELKGYSTQTNRPTDDGNALQPVSDGVHGVVTAGNHYGKDSKEPRPELVPMAIYRDRPHRAAPR